MLTRKLVWLLSPVVHFAFAAFALAEESPSFPPDQLEFFEKEVRPILVAKCYECHSGKVEEPKGNLRLDSREAALKGGDTRPAIDLKEPKKSLLVESINYAGDYNMPPKTKLPDAEIAVLTKWAELGAPWPAEAKPATQENTAKVFDLAARKASHWCWQAIADPPLPEVKNAAWSKDNLDRFILAKIEAAGFTPAAPADKHALIRRIYFDLIGLPPTPEQVRKFLDDNSPDAVAHVVDELLESPHFGERWGRHWLDLMRYAESRGHEFDYNAPNAYQYRDYVIRALNEDVPYDQFVTEHLAGDLVAKPRLSKDVSPVSGEGKPPLHFNESILGTGFWFLGEWIHSPVDIRKDEADRFDNMVDVFSKSFLGLTVSCARCHDHKFDAISQKDYYALFGFLQSSAYRLARFDTMLEEERIAGEIAALNKKMSPEIKQAIFESQRPSLERMADYLLASRQVILEKLSGEDFNRLVESKKLSGPQLEKWVAYLRQAAGQPHDAFYHWAKLCDVRGDNEDALIDAVEKSASQFFEQERNAYAKSPHQVVCVFTREPRVETKPVAEPDGLLAKRPFLQWLANIRNPPPTDHVDPWIENGIAFGEGPSEVGDLVFSSDPAKPIADIAQYAAARVDLATSSLRAGGNISREAGRLEGFDRAGRTIRTPTFEVKHGVVHALVRGHGEMYAAVDSHNLIQGPLHGQIVAEFSQGDDKLRWVSMDLRAYLGHKIHIEFTPHGAAPLEVVKVVEGERPNVMFGGMQSIDGLVQFGATFDIFAGKRTLKSFAEAYQQLFLNEDVGAPYMLAWTWNHRDLIPFDETKTRDVFAKYSAERKKITDQIRPESRYAMAMWDGDGQNEVLMIRGNPHITGPEVPRRFLEAVSGTEPMKVSGGGSGRLELAKELTSATNPLTSRVMVNRIWHHLFGRGIVPSVDNFGVLGQAPTHPELLDHLATRFSRDGWSVKKMIRTIMLSQTYQMASTQSDPKAEEADPKNLLWRRTNIRRLQAEAIRDEILAVSGRLDRTMYGPSTPVHLTEFMQGRGRPGDGPLDGNGRRSVYLSIRRNFLSPFMLAFDAPIPFSTMGARNVSNVPAQALILMNDPFVIQQANLWAQKTLALPDRTPQERITLMYQTAFAREPSEAELLESLDFIETTGKEYGLSTDAAKNDQRVWADLAHVLMNVKEFVFLN